MVSAEEHRYKEAIDHLLGKRHWKKLILAWFEMGAQEVRENFQWRVLGVKKWDLDLSMWKTEQNYLEPPDFLHGDSGSVYKGFCMQMDLSKFHDAFICGCIEESSQHLYLLCTIGSWDNFGILN